ncbi:ABC-ATPase domain-containing protein [Zhaonella formicivorans]|uniref:ABC-ATPase domain-containing protein n=1 Tax=Zhaonella formicivorans TaxID=2528593 RepID=UPI0010E27B28|nr:ABC-ATPase domain-containing protein [Zhaonella formicivorans]
MEQLRKKLLEIDGKGYKAYKDIQGTYQGKGMKLHIDYVQGDPFASPSRIRVELPNTYRQDWYHPKWRKIAFEDFLARETAKMVRSRPTDRKGSGKSGLILIDTPGQEVIPRTAVKISAQSIEVRLSVGLPADGRRVLGKQAAQLLCDAVPAIVLQAVLQFDHRSLVKHLELADRQETIRQYLDEHGYVCFIANGSVLPRASGISNLPLKGNVIPFQSPPSLEIEIPVPHGGTIRGMAIPRGITLIVGGGYHGKSTLLKAVERGIYNHIGGDGREYVLTNSTAYKVRAEDGRRVEKVNISPFIANLPFGKDTVRFSTDDASGSTSQAANIMEALEAGSQVLLIDEDTSATNFMIRDVRMQELVGKDKEPITPFIDKVRQLYEDYKVSTILVLGGSGDYFDVADHVIMMDEYRPVDVTERAKKIAEMIKYDRKKEGGEGFGQIAERVIKKQSFNAHRGNKEKIDAKGLSTIIYGTDSIDLSYVEQLVDPGQTRAIAWMIKFLADKLADETTPLPQLLDRLYRQVEEKGLEVISPYFGKHPGDLALPRKLELAAAINRLRTLQVK